MMTSASVTCLSVTNKPLKQWKAGDKLSSRNKKNNINYLFCYKIFYYCFVKESAGNKFVEESSIGTDLRKF